MVAHTGFEPVISALRGRCPEPLDECAIDLTGYIIANSSLFVNSEKGVFEENTCGQSRRGREGQNGNYGVFILASFAVQRRLFAQINVELLALMEEAKGQPGPAFGPMRLRSVAIIGEA